MKYVLITAAKNEADFIEDTILGILHQESKPVKWIIVDDDSSDLTYDIIRSFEIEHSFIQSYRRRNLTYRSFSSKVQALHKAINLIGSVDYDLIGNLDADIVLAPDYYSRIIRKFMHNKQLGIAGGRIVESHNNRLIKQRISLDSVAGAVQLFRKKCFHESVGYQKIPYGGEDALIEISVKQNGWEVCTFPELYVFHQRPVGTGEGSRLQSKLREGKMFYSIGYHPLFMLARNLSRMTEDPIIIGALLELCGYFSSLCKREEQTIPKNLKLFLQKEQVDRLKKILINSLPISLFKMNI